MGMRRAARCEGKQFSKGVSFNKYFLALCSIFLILLSSIILMNLQSTASCSRANGNEPEIDYLVIKTQIDNNYATTDIYEKFRNPYNYSVDETFSFEIPEKAFISNFSLTICNKTHYAQIVPKDIGKQKYEGAVVNGTDAGLVEANGKNIFSYSVSMSAYQEIIVGLRYEKFLEKSLGGYEYIIPLKGGSANRNINDFSVDITVKAKLFVNDLQVQNYKDQTKVYWLSANEVKVALQTSLTAPQDDFIINYELASPPINGSMLNFHDDIDEFFFHIFSPQRTDLGGQAMAKEIIFVLDKSGSMSGKKIQQLKEAFNEIINQLPEQDSFNIVMFDQTIKKYKEELIAVSEKNKADAVNYINGIQAGGSTNINEALTTALDMFMITETKVPIIVMLTDGLPTAGVTNTQTIRENIKNENSAGVSIFCLGFGFDVDFEFLKAMALENYGMAIRIYEGEDASEQITNFYETISTPLLKGLKFSYSDGAYEIYPTTVDQLFEGAEVVVVGKYNGTDRRLSSMVEATSWEGMKVFGEVFPLDDSNNNSFIPRFWAYAKIRYLLDELAVVGYNESIVDNVTELGLTYGFVTPYTSLLVEIIEPESESESETEKDTDADFIPDDEEPAHQTDQSNSPTQDSDNDGLPDTWELTFGLNPNDPSDANSDPDCDGATNLEEYMTATDPCSYPKDQEKESGNGGEDDKDIPFGMSEEASSDMLAIGPIIVIFFVFLLIPVFLYSKIRRDKLLEQKTREAIFNYIQENPGEHFRGIQKALNLEVGVMAHHINKLEHEEFIKSRQDRQYRRFYPMDAKIDMKLILSQIQEKILNWIKRNPGVTGSTIAENIGVDKHLVLYHVKVLQQAGFIHTEQQGREKLCFSAVGV